jgi:hypothetical protein
MTTIVYLIHKGINKPITFKGLQGQYILYGGAILTGDMLLFAILYIGGVSTWISLPLTMTLGSAGILTISRLSHRYGAFGLLKKRAARRLPPTLRSHSQKLFISLKK